MILNKRKLHPDASIRKTAVKRGNELIKRNGKLESSSAK